MAITTDVNHADANLRAVAEIRNLIGEPHLIFQDDAYLSHLRLTGADNAGAASIAQRLLAAAFALDAIGSSEAYVQKVIETLGLKTDGAKLGDSYRAHAKNLRAQATPPVGTVVPVTDSTIVHGKAIRSRRVDGDDCGGCSEYAPRFGRFGKR